MNVCILRNLVLWLLPLRILSLMYCTTLLLLSLRVLVIKLLDVFTRHHSWHVLPRLSFRLLMRMIVVIELV
jgi:hypothetical protein